MEAEIIVRITKEGWSETLKVDGKEFKKSYIKTNTESEGEQICWEDDPKVPEMAYPAFDELTNGCQEAMYVLRSFDEGC